MRIVWSSLVLVMASTVGFYPRASAGFPPVNTVVRCEGQGLLVRVIAAGDQEFLVVHDHGRAVVYQETTRKVIAGSQVTIVTYQAGNIWEGGARLSIRTADRRFPTQQGLAHLSMRRGGDVNNSRIYCSLYEPGEMVEAP